nr:MAG TPA: hypothetical protein [Caudoviricetes sp.]
MPGLSTGTVTTVRVIRTGTSAVAHFVRFSIFYGIIDLFVKIMPQVRFLTPW